MKTMICLGCGEEVEKRRTPYCPDCSMQRCLESAKQIHKKKGPFYEKWRTRLIASLGG